MSLPARRTGFAFAVTSALAALAVSSLPSHGDIGLRSDAERFETRVRPLLLAKCGACHGAASSRSGLRLDSRPAMLSGGQRGAAVAPGDPDRSLLIQAVRYSGSLKMPPSGPLSATEVESLTQWVQQGAVWPASVTPKAGPPISTHSPATGTAAKFWSFVPVKRPPVPVVRRASRILSPIDAFLAHDLEARGLTPAPPADRRTLVRRATFDLTGLPPTPQEVDAFLTDRSPGAWERVIDRLLSSPRYGERWGRHWLDIARYADSADSRGSGSDGDISEAWRYRDWVIDAFNRDMPYNEFVMNQIAGDLLPPSRQPGARTAALSTGHEMNVPGTIATTLLAIGNWGNGDADKDKILTDIADDQVDIVSRGFMGLTVGCARCHDHKFDPITTKDYYGLAGIFFSTHILPKLTPKGAGEVPLRIPLETEADREQRAAYAARLAALEQQSQAFRTQALAAYARAMLPQTEKYLMAAWEYAHRPVSDRATTVEAFAAQKGLVPFALRQWQDYLSLNSYRIMTTPFDRPGGVDGVYGFHGSVDNPTVLINANPDPKMILTFTLPPRSVCVHPGPTNGVVVGWKSPISGVVEISGRVVDADAACGNGVAWMLDHRGALGPVALTGGAFDNGGNQDLTQGKPAAALNTVTVRQGDSIELIVLPKGEYSCDMTFLDLTIKERGGTRVWNLAGDILADSHRSPQHADRYGNADTWRFYDMADSHRGEAGAPQSDPQLAAWHEAVSSAETDGGPQAAERVQTAARAFQASFTLADSRSPFWISQAADESALPADVRTRLREQAAELADLRRNAPPPIAFANGAQEGGVPESPHAGVHDVHVHIRGSYARLGDLVPRRFPIVLAGENQPPIAQGSGRLELARWIASDTHPTTARVIVNRIWQHHFGQGIVRTPSNFGKLGERPTNQPLLDWLASEFVQNGWSIKRMHRMIMLSAAYQQSSTAAAAALRIDPDNRLFGRQNRFRLEAEALRDSLLSASGRLDTAMGGPAFREFAVPRRTVYYVTIRSDRSGFGPLFDAADSTATMDHRTVSNVAPQALFLMNNAFALAQTATLANRLIAAAPDDAARIAFAYRLLYSRPPLPQETKLGLEFLAHTRSRPAEKPAAGKDANPDLRAWTAYSQILLCANEFLYID